MLGSMIGRHDIVSTGLLYAMFHVATRSPTAFPSAPCRDFQLLQRDLECVLLFCRWPYMACGGAVAVVGFHIKTHGGGP